MELETDEKPLSDSEDTSKREPRSAATLKKDMPRDTIIRILSILPLKSVLRFRYVSKEWASLISDPLFAKNYDKYKKPGSPKYSNTNTEKILLKTDKIHSVDTNEFDLGKSAMKILEFPRKLPYFITPVGSCDGVICGVSESNCFIWIPSIEYCRKLPEPFPVRHKISDTYWVYRGFGFGYDSISADFKILLITFYNDLRDHTDNTVQVFSWRKNSWRMVQDFLYPYHHHIIYSRRDLSPILCNGALHWRVQKYNEQQVREFNKIISFNLSQEIFGEVPLPDDRVFWDVIGVVEGCLCLPCYGRITTDLQLWIMKEYGVKKSWEIFLSIRVSIPKRIEPLCVMRSGEIMIICENELVKLDPVDKTVKKLKIPGHWLFGKAIVHEDTLAPFDRL